MNRIVAAIALILAAVFSRTPVPTNDDGSYFLYRPLIARGDYVHAESKGLIDRLFDGQLEPFVAHFSEREDLSPAQIARLRQLIERLGRDK